MGSFFLLCSKKSAYCPLLSSPLFSASPPSFSTSHLYSSSSCIHGAAIWHHDFLYLFCHLLYCRESSRVEITLCIMTFYSVWISKWNLWKYVLIHSSSNSLISVTQPEISASQLTVKLLQLGHQAHVSGKWVFLYWAGRVPRLLCLPLSPL